jgi:hypothetical protein
LLQFVQIEGLNDVILCVAGPLACRAATRQRAGVQAGIEPGAAGTWKRGQAAADEMSFNGILIIRAIILDYQ